MELKEFKELLGKHKVSLVMLRDAHYVAKKDKEVRDAFEDLISNYPIKDIESQEKMNNNNRRSMIVQDIIASLRAL